MSNTDIKPDGNQLQCPECHALFAGFKSIEVGAVQAGKVRKLILSDRLPLADFSNALPDGSVDVLQCTRLGAMLLLSTLLKSNIGARRGMWTNLISLMAVTLALQAQTPTHNAGGKQAPASQSKMKATSRSAPETAKEPTPISGFAVAPMVLTDEGCARDYVRAFQAEGVELRKRLADLETYKCVDTSARGVFVAIATERKDFAIEKGNAAYFRKVIMSYDPKRTEVAVGNSVVSTPGSQVYSGWIMDEDFYPVSSQEFDRLLAEKKIPMRVTGNVGKR